MGQKWPHSIECGIFKPETMPYTPFAKQCILDTCIQGLTPRIYKKSIEEWVTILSKVTRNERASKDIKEELKKLYKEFRLAIYIRAFTLQRLSRQLLANRKKELANKLKTSVEYAHTTKKTKISWKLDLKRNHQKTQTAIQNTNKNNRTLMNNEIKERSREKTAQNQTGRK